MNAASRRGFALPLAIMLIAVLTAAIVAGFAATTGETVVNNAQRAQERAYQLAEAGLQQFALRRGDSGFCSVCVADPALADSEYTRVPLAGGYADVTARSVRMALLDQPAIYFIRSRGVDTAALLGGAGSTTFAERTVGMYARWNTLFLQVQGALTSFNGITNSKGTISGNDNCGGQSPFPRLPNDLVTVAMAGTSFNGQGITTDSSSGLEALRARLALDWNAIVNENGIPADITIPPDAWPTSYAADYWPVIRIKTSAAAVVPSIAGQHGVIIADSDFTSPRGTDWDGLVLVGGRVLVSGSGKSTASLNGAIITGLNRLLPGAGTPPIGDQSDNDLADNAHDYRYNSCTLMTAGQRIRGYSLLPNTWMDNVAAW